MKVFVLNCGSSSIKYQLIDMDNESLLAKGSIERVGEKNAYLKHTTIGKQPIEFTGAIFNHKDGVQKVLEVMVDKERGVIKSMAEINAVGHRVVHGGERFSESVLITDEVLQGIEACSEMAPLHNPANIIGIRACQELMPTTPQVAVFDTAFHQTMGKEAFLFALPYEYYKKYGLRRYGFHGTSHRYVASQIAKMLGKKAEDLKIISCHLGNGASICAIKNGKSVDTSMGYTPLDGLVMGTRCGEVDPAVIPFLMNKEHLDCQGIDELMNRKSGVLGISGFSSDFRDLAEEALKGNEKCQLAINIFAHRVKKYIGAYAAVMGGVDVIVFTAGVGENRGDIRKLICQGLEYLGTKLDLEKNKVRSEDVEISVAGSKVKLWVIATNEELVIARDTLQICNKLNNK